MEASRVIVGGKKPEREPPRPDIRAAWKALLVTALILTLVGVVDVVLAFIPPAFEAEGWLFRVLTGVVGGMPLLSLGLAGGVLAAGAGGRTGWRRLFGGVSLLAALGVLVVLVVYAGLVGAALAATAQDALPLVRKMVARTFVVGGSFFLLLGFTAWTAFRGWGASDT